MKTLFSLIFLSIVLYQYANAQWTEESRQFEAEQVMLWENKLEEAKQKPATIRLADLHLGLKSMGHRKTFDGRDAAVDTIYTKLQAELLSIPEHAKHFADLIENERKKVENVPFNFGPRIDYDRNRMWHLETLAHLPSPETIKVLGDYLSDERDRHEMTHKETEGVECISGGSTGNSTFSAKALEKSELRNKPYREGKVYDIEVAKAEWRSWWEQVKAGQQTFSFVGQKVEYRFKPDGTWDTIALLDPPNDGAKRGEQNKQAKATNAVDSTAKPEGYRWCWLTVSLMLALLGVAWLNKKKAA